MATWMTRRLAPTIVAVFIVLVMTTLSAYRTRSGGLRGDELPERATTEPTTLAAASPRAADPAAWGSDHVGRSLPPYVTGDECLFCHRDIGPNWPTNRHQLSMRPAAATEPAMIALHAHPSLNDESPRVDLLLGTSAIVRFLHRSSQYGKVETLAATFHRHRDGTTSIQAPPTPETWNLNLFSDRCAGCHATAVDQERLAFSAISIDCFACHGVIELDHSKPQLTAFLGKGNQEARQVISTCGQCHLRGGRSRSTGHPYPNQFVPGDNLFRDWEVDLMPASLNAMHPTERHIFENARSVVIEGQTEMTCLSCHEIHTQSNAVHESLPESAACQTCHHEEADIQAASATNFPNRICEE